MVALPVFGAASGRMERLVRASPVEERALARRIYLYAALLFGLVATIVALVALLRLVLAALLGAAETDLAAELGRWLGYTLIGAAIAFYYGTLLRRVGAVPTDAGQGVTIAIVANEPLLAALATGFARELPGAAVRATRIDGADAEQVLDGADVVVVDVAAALDGRLARVIQAFPGRRLLLAAPGSGYEVIGARLADDALVREAIRSVRAGLNTPSTTGSPPVAALPAASS